MMLAVKHWATALFDVYLSLKHKWLKWKAENQAEQLHLKQLQTFSEHDLSSQLKIRSAHLEHEISIIKTKHQTQLGMLKVKCKQDIKDYEQYLASLDALKLSIQSNYKHLPDVIAFTIHHHAKQLLNAMWEAQSMDEKLFHELQLIRFMASIHEDAQLRLKGSPPCQLPEKTLQLLQQQEL